jgi:Mg2+/citrate symporter
MSEKPPNDEIIIEAEKASYFAVIVGTVLVGLVCILIVAYMVLRIRRRRMAINGEKEATVPLVDSE